MSILTAAEARSMATNHTRVQKIVESIGDKITIAAQNGKTTTNYLLSDDAADLIPAVVTALKSRGYHVTNSVLSRRVDVVWK